MSVDESIWSVETCRRFFEAAGGKKNIAGLSCCSTRVRIALYEVSTADKTVLSSLPGVKGIIERGTSLHLVIGWNAPVICRNCIGQLEKSE
jgi:phosphotransferase system IIB component